MPRDRGCALGDIPKEVLATHILSRCADNPAQISVLRLVCTEFQALVDVTVRSLQIKSWPPVPLDMASRWPKVSSVEVRQHNERTALPLPKPCKQLTATCAYPLMESLSRFPELHTLNLGALHANPRRARDFAVRFVANVARLPNCTALSLPGSGISHLPPTLFCSLSKLTHLSIDGCRMRTLPAGLGLLSNLSYLSAANSSKLQAVPEVLMAKLSNLQYLDLRGCKLASLPSLSELHSLKHLDFSENKLQTLPCCTHLTGLTRLQMGSNWQLDEGSLHAAFPACMPVLVVLDASGMGLRSLPANLSCPVLEELQLSSNELSQVPACLRTMRRPRTLSLDYNNIKQVPDWLGNATALTSLDMSGNSLSSLPESFGGLGRTLAIFLGTSNALGSLPRSFSSLRSLTELDLSDNKLGPQLPPVVWQLPSLTLLAVASNGLQGLSQEVASLKLLRWLDVSDNLIESLPLHVLQCNLEVLKVNGNKLNEADASHFLLASSSRCSFRSDGPAAPAAQKQP